MKIDKYLKYYDIKYLGEGFRSKSYIIDNKYIFLEGNNDKSYKTYKKDYKVLNFLKDKIKTVLIPNNVILVKKDNDNPTGGLIYKIINDQVFNYDKLKTYNLDNIAFEISVFLNELHSIKIAYNYEKIITKDLKNIKSNINKIKKFISKKYFENLDSFYKEYENFTKHNKKLYLVHGDLWYENYIISKDGNHLKGIIDFENCKYFYKEDDLVPMTYLGNKFLDKVILNYKYKVLKENIKIFKIRREVISFNYLLKYFPEEKEDQLKKIIDSLK